MPVLQVVSASDAVAEIRAAINDHADKLGDAILEGDARLSDQRVPLPGSVTWARLAGGLVGTAAGTVAAGDDFRFSNSRTPTAHHATHEPGGSDALDLSKLHMGGTKAAMTALTPSDYPSAYFYATDDWGGSLYQSSGGQWVLRASKNQLAIAVTNGAGGTNDLTVDGDTDGAYELTWAFYVNTGGGPFWLRFNDDQAANYTPDVVTDASHHALVLSATSIGISRQMGRAIIHAQRAGSTRRVVDIVSSTDATPGGGSFTNLRQTGYWTNTADNITKITVSNQFNPITGRIVLRRLAQP